MRSALFCAILQGTVVSLPTFRHNLSVKKIQDFLDLLTLDDGTNRLSGNAGKEWPLFAQNSADSIYPFNSIHSTIFQPGDSLQILKSASLGDSLQIVNLEDLKNRIE
jgi:hypothetical protein